MASKKLPFAGAAAPFGSKKSAPAKGAAKVKAAKTKAGGAAKKAKAKGMKGK